MTTLHDQLDQEFAESWRPAAGDILEGAVTQIGTNDAGWGIYPIVTVQPSEEDGAPSAPVAFHAFHSVAKAQLADLRPEIGETIAIKYLGTREPRDGGKPYHAYRAVIEGRDSGTVDWDQIGASATREMAEDRSTASNTVAQQKARERDQVREDTGAGRAKKKAAASPSDEIPF